MSFPHGPKDWEPVFRDPQTEAGLELQRYLKGCVILDGEGSIDLNDKSPVYVAVVHEGGSYVPGAAISVDQGHRDLEHQVLETAFEIMTEHAMKNVEYVKEIQEEWGDDWQDILTEGFDGKVWTFKNPKEAELALRGDERVMKFIDIEQPDRRR
jgi:hypothetical protein